MKIGNLILFNSLENIEEKFETQNKSGFKTCQLCCWNIEFLNEENATLKNMILKYLLSGVAGAVLPYGIFMRVQRPWALFPRNTESKGLRSF